MAPLLTGAAIRKLGEQLAEFCFWLDILQACWGVSTSPLAQKLVSSIFEIMFSSGLTYLLVFSCFVLGLQFTLFA